MFTCRKSLSLLIAVIFSLTILNATVLQATEFTLQDGTAVNVETLERMKSGDNKVGESVPMRVKQDVMSEEGEILIKSGARAYGTITESEPHGMFGKAGKLNFQLNYVQGIDGSQIPLRATLENKGKGCSGVVIASFLLLSVASMFFNGDNVVIPPGTELTAYVDCDTIVNVKILDKVNNYEQVNGSGLSSTTAFNTNSGRMQIYSQDNFVILDFAQKKLAFTRDDAQVLESILTKALMKFQNAEDKKMNIANEHVGTLGENLKVYFWSTENATNTCINMQYKGGNNRFSKKDVLNMINALNQI